MRKFLKIALPLLLLAVLRPLGLDGMWLNTPITSALVSLLALYLLGRMRRKPETSI